MPSRANPNVPNKMRRKSNRAKVQKARAGIAKNPRGTAASSVLHPTSGPLAPVSGKKARKLQKAQNYARQRALEQALQEQEEDAMTDAPKTKSAKKTEKADKDEKMDIE